MTSLPLKMREKVFVKLPSELGERMRVELADPPADAGPAEGAYPRGQLHRQVKLIAKMEETDSVAIVGLRVAIVHKYHLHRKIPMATLYPSINYLIGQLGRPFEIFRFLARGPGKK